MEFQANIFGMCYQNKHDFGSRGVLLPRKCLFDRNVSFKTDISLQNIGKITFKHDTRCRAAKWSNNKRSHRYSMTCLPQVMKLRRHKLVGPAIASPLLHSCQDKPIVSECWLAGWLGAWGRCGEERNHAPVNESAVSSHERPCRLVPSSQVGIGA